MTVTDFFFMCDSADYFSTVVRVVNAYNGALLYKGTFNDLPKYIATRKVNSFAFAPRGGIILYTIERSL